MASTATAPTPTPRRTRKAERTRARILAAAEGRFARDGFEATSLEAIAAEIDIAASGILYHFQDKRALYLDVLESSFGEGLDCVSDALETPGGLLERIERGTRAGVHYLAERPTTARILLREASARDPALHPVMRRHAERIVRIVEEMLLDGVERGALRPVVLNPGHLLAAMFGPLLFYIGALPAFMSADDPDHLAPDEVAALERELLAIAWALLGVPTREPR